MQSITLSKLYPKNISYKPLDINTLAMTTFKETPPMFTIEKLVRRRNKEKLQLQSVYEKIYNQCLQQIELADNMKKEHTTVEIPFIVYGHNNYSQKECLNYVNDKLNQDGLDTLILYDKKIYISWFKIEEKYN